MQLQQLLYLKTVAETKSIRKASERLFVSQQAISQSLKSLEETYEVQLLKRSVHGVTLTETGLYAVSVAEKILVLSDALEAYFMEQAAELLSGELRIAAIHSFKDYLFPGAKVEFLQHYPEVDIIIQSMETEQVVKTVQKKQAEIGFMGMMFVDNKPLFEIPPLLHFHTLSQYEYYATIGINSALNKYQTLSIKSILQYPVIFLQEQLQNNLEGYLPYQVLSQFGEVHVLIADSAKLFGSMIAANMGVGISSDGVFLEENQPKTVMKPLRDNVYGRFGYLVHEDCKESLLVKKFLDILHHVMSIE